MRMGWWGFYIRHGRPYRVSGLSSAEFPFYVAIIAADFFECCSRGLSDGVLGIVLPDSFNIAL